jgi:hypothetical protein
MGESSSSTQVPATGSGQVPVVVVSLMEEVVWANRLHYQGLFLGLVVEISRIPELFAAVHQDKVFSRVWILLHI